MQSPDHLRISLAAAMELGIRQGFFHRGARLHCVNLLQTYDDGCRANCAFCGLSRERSGLHPEKRFIRVEWPTASLDDIIARLRRIAPAGVVQRVCLSMVTHPRAMDDALEITSRLAGGMDLPISVLTAPTLMGAGELQDLKRAGAERIGVAIDCATPELFDLHRGGGVRGPHRWERYWRVYGQALEVFGPSMAGVHLIRGLGESERDLALAMQRARDMGGFTHLFSFYPEGGSRLALHPQPPLGSYRRIQVARWLIDHDLGRAEAFAHDEQGAIVDFGVDRAVLDAALARGSCFMTSGCPGATLETACNRPFANERPGQDIRNFPFPPEQEDKALCARQLWE